MQIRICACSDNHGDYDVIEKIKNDNPNCDYYFHLGDSSLNEKALEPFISVEGNNDWESFYPKKRIIEIQNHKFLLAHGHGYTYSLGTLSQKAKQENCDVFIFGHTHSFVDIEYDGIRLINPGSCWHNRDLSEPCYAIIVINEDGTIDVERINIK